MNNEKIDCTYGLKLLKAGYTLLSSKSNEKFYYRDNKIIIIDDNHRIDINEYSFLDLYKETKFLVDQESDEEEVDIKKDEEYYSWRQ